MQLLKGIHMLSVTAAVMGSESTIYPVFIEDGSHRILVDTGYPGAQCLPRIDAALQEIGSSIAALTGVILTHQDLDHIGGLPLILQDHKAEVMAHADERPFVEGEKKLVKIVRNAAHNIDSLPREMQEAFKRILENPPTAKVDRLLADGETLPWCGGIDVLHTPGHTPGHICLYVRAAKLLIAGDALVAGGGKLYGPVPEHAADIRAAYDSLKKLLDYDIEKVVCYHGGLAEEGTGRIRAILEAYSG
jgi:glyoxylase-like metal-dependent hydrolase (beta-lactamase superfamily II)